MAMRKRPQITELSFDRKVEELALWASEAVSPFKDRSKTEQTARIKRAENDYFFFARTYLPHYFESESAEFHAELIERVDARPLPGIMPFVMGAAAAPRGFSKSTVVSFGYSLWCLVFRKRHFIIIGSETADLAEEIVASIGVELKENPRIRYDFSIRLAKLAGGELVVAGGGKVKGRGAGQQMRGLKHRNKRPDLIILDDMESDESGSNPKRVKKLLNWVKGTVIGAFGKIGTLFWVGTIVANGSALDTVLNSDDEPWPNWWRKKYQAIKKDGTSLWPQRYPIEELKALKAGMGSVAFEREKQNNPLDKDAMFQDGWLKFFGFDPRTPPPGMALAAFADPSARDGESHDYKALITVGLYDLLFFVLDAFIRKCSLATFAEAIVARSQELPFTVLGIEDNGFQALFVEAVQNAADEEGVIIPLRPIGHHGISKEMRLAGLSPLVERGKVLFLPPDKRDADYKRLIEQLTYFPSTIVHDDGPDALEGAVSLLRPLAKGIVGEYKSVAKRRAFGPGRGIW